MCQDRTLDHALIMHCGFQKKVCKWRQVAKLTVERSIGQVLHDVSRRTIRCLKCDQLGVEPTHMYRHGDDRVELEKLKYHQDKRMSECGQCGSDHVAIILLFAV
jgi:hypothetical protein